MSFVDLLKRAECLDNKVDYSKVKEPPVDLKNVFLASGDICKRRQLRTDMDWKEAELPQTSTPRQSVLKKPSEALSAASATLVDGYVLKSLDRTRIESERAFINQCILERANAAPSSGRGPYSQAGGADNAPVDSMAERVTEHQQTVFAKHVSKFLSSSCTESIQPAIVQAVQAMKSKETEQIWSLILPILTVEPCKSAIDLTEFRQSEKWVKHVLERSTSYLQVQYKHHMETVIESNLEVSRRGGVPGTASLVDAYLNVTLNRRFEYTDGSAGKHPVWPFIFCCLRLGDLAVAERAAKSLSNIPNCSVLVSCIRGLATTPLDADRKMKLNAEWKHEASHCKDPYKYALYAMFLGGECPEVTDDIEVWLWLKLMTCKLDSTNGHSQFRKLQTTICVDLGEEYFTSGATNFLPYFEALWLTGQIERALYFLYKSGFVHHAVHAVILCYQKRLLQITQRVSDPFLTPHSKDPVVCYFNFARLLLLYVKNFEMVNVDYALSYAFFLRQLTFENDSVIGESNIFESYVSRLCYLTGETDVILGKLSSEGQSKLGLINKFKDAVNPADIISRVANDSDVSGDTLTACRLFLLTDKPKEAFQLCSKHLANVMTSALSESCTASKEAEETLKLAYWLQDLFTQRETPLLDSGTRMELDTLIKLNIFYGAAKNEPQKALDIIRQLKLIPFTNDELQVRIADFVHVSDKVKGILHHVVLALLDLFLRIAKSSEGDEREKLRSMVKVVLLFIAQVNCRFPAHVNTKILQLQSQI